MLHPVRFSKVYGLGLRALVIALAISLFVGMTASADAAKVGYPNSMAATGDSITRAFNMGWFPFTDAPSNSWSTGTNSTVNSQYLRILAKNSHINGLNYNDARSGTMMADLNGQVTTVVSQKVEYVTILMGANDVCTSSLDTMTPVDTYRLQFATALAALSSGLPDARISVSSVPNVHHLWEIFYTNSSAVINWNFWGTCHALLANPTSLAQADVDRRNAVKQRVMDFNTQLSQVCAQYIHCRFDNNAAFNLQFTTSAITSRDYFHPAITGQAKAAGTSWAATFNFEDHVAPRSTASTISVGGGVNVTLSANDNVGVSGIEYKMGASAWTVYIAPVFVASGNTLTWRAVDVNGNLEATHTLTAP